MRCSNCGTENAPDSRFCGGCGARMQTSGLVAPTQKISDDAPYPSSGPSSIPPQNYATPAPGYSSGPASIPPQNYQQPISYPPQNTTYPPQNNSVPPQNNSIPPQNNSIPPRPATQPPISQRVATQPPVPTPQGTPSQPRTKSNGVPAVSRKAPAFSDPSISPPPRRKWGLIVTVLLIDLALAGAGVYLLAEGLA